MLTFLSQQQNRRTKPSSNGIESFPFLDSSEKMEGLKKRDLPSTLPKCSGVSDKFMVGSVKLPNRSKARKL